MLDSPSARKEDRPALSILPRRYFKCSASASRTWWRRGCCCFRPLSGRERFATASLANRQPDRVAGRACGRIPGTQPGELLRVVLIASRSARRIRSWDQFAAPTITAPVATRRSSISTPRCRSSRPDPGRDQGSGGAAHVGSEVVRIAPSSCIGCAPSIRPEAHGHACAEERSDCFDVVAEPVNEREAEAA